MHKKIWRKKVSKIRAKKTWGEIYSRISFLIFLSLSLSLSHLTHTFSEWRNYLHAIVTIAKRCKYSNLPDVNRCKLDWAIYQTLSCKLGQNLHFRLLQCKGIVRKCLERWNGSSPSIYCVGSYSHRTVLGKQIDRLSYTGFYGTKKTW